MPTNNIKEGYFTDYISGLPVKETPEELEAVQPFSKILVDDYGYPKEFIHTRPQYRVKARPSDRRKRISRRYRCFQQLRPRREIHLYYC